MPPLHPFRGWRYDPAVAGDLARLVTQPYDKISPDLQRDYAARSPYNAVHVTLNLEKLRNPETDYPEAGRAFERWVAEGALVQDRAPAIYACYQEYEHEGDTLVRKGFIALLDLRRSGAGIVPHEHTLAGPKQDRLRLMCRLEANDDLIFMLYADERGMVNETLDQAASGAKPDAEVTDDFGVRHRLWAVTDPAKIGAVQGAMESRELLIADGHHRYETSMNFMRECEGRGWRTAAVESFDKRLAACFNLASSGITILPTHRLVRDLKDWNAGHFLKRAESYFETARVPSANALWETMKRARGKAKVLGFYAGRQFTLLRLRDTAQLDRVLAGRSEPYRRLDVAILHALVLDRLLGIDEAKLAAQAHVDYARDRDGCVQRVDDGGYQAAFFLNPTSVEEVQQVANQGERMPQKSTDFYPKLLTGLVFMKMAIAK